MKSRIIVMVVAFWGMTAIWAQDSTPWYMCIWVFDPDWGGGKIKSWNYEPTEGLKFFSEAMKGRLKVQK